MDFLLSDCLYEVATFIDCGSDWKSWMFLGSRYFDCSKFFPDNQFKFTSRLDLVLSMTPQLIGLKWNILSSFPLTLPLLIKYNQYWDWVVVSENPSVTTAILQYCVDQHIDNKLNWDMVSSYAILTPEFIQTHLDKPWNWSLMSRNKSINWDIVKNNADRPWYWEFLSSNPAMTWEIISSNLKYPWDWDYISKRPEITWEIVKENPQLPWSFSDMSYNPSLRWDVVRSNLGLCWNWSGISKYCAINSQIIRENLKLPWDWYNMSFNPSLTWSIIQENNNRPWNWKAICCNHSVIIGDNDPKTSWRIVCQIPYNMRDWYWLSENLPWEIIGKKMDEPWKWCWQWSWISKNKSITWDIVCSHSPQRTSWNFYNLFLNKAIPIACILARFNEASITWFL